MSSSSACRRNVRALAGSVRRRWTLTRRSREVSGRFWSSQDDGRRIMITRNTVASQLRDYLQHRTTRASLVDWAERAMMEEESFQGIADAFYSLAGLATCTSERLLSTTGGLINGSFASQLRVIDSAAYALFDFAFQRLRLPFDLVSIHDS